MAEVDSREARRRRRILQQGSDRLAFITGQIQALPNPSSDLPNTDLPHGDGEAEDDSNSISLNPDDSKTSITPKPSLDEVRSEISSLSISEIEPEHEQIQTQVFADSTSEEISQQQSRALEPQRFTFINPSDLSSAINASRVTRLCCSIFVALLVVASYLGFSQLINTVISFRPLYLVLLTNITVVVARLFTGKQTRRRQNSTESSEYSQVAKTLEIGLVLQTVIDAVFMDCSVYAIVVICGLSLVNL